jgi:Fic family protein
VDWTYNSNAIEGSLLSRGETMFFLSEGLTVEGKPFKDFLDAKNHAEAIDLLMDMVANSRALSEGVIKEVNVLLLHGVTHTEAITPDGQRIKKPLHAGLYKVQPNHVLKQDGTLHQYVSPEQVPAQMESLVRWINTEIERLHPIVVAAVAHYNMVRIHPFGDGNGRGARILMNMVLLNQGYFPAVIYREQKRKYLETLEQADRGDIEPFIQLITSQLIETQQRVLEDLGIALKE